MALGNQRSVDDAALEAMALGNQTSLDADLQVRLKCTRNYVKVYNYVNKIDYPIVSIEDPFDMEDWEQVKYFFRGWNFRGLFMNACYGGCEVVVPLPIMIVSTLCES
ncbi:cytosolic enolase 3 [Tanacetum coccineum]